MTNETCFGSQLGQHISDFIDELLVARCEHLTPFYGIFNDRLIIVTSNCTKDELLDSYFK